ncbi:GNAT family N-acetyltransferase [Spartinivicinus poritis]|uniref:GNAT family N-acetyltransferase n=1 Tax=Spartinivicinus poritis TaxID=2994640 RepID=A0ABT5UCD1_9GAMM|nr:GNAT family N-acetyltransferase [Spartinivicinus sp. A2-2]MDE1463651.1 GNAT family N-acetyltransferase [Spartinivicinus sp. A2-2]
MYQVIEEVVDVDNFLRLRKVSGLSPRPKQAAVKALPNSVYGVHICLNGKPVGMGRIIGDGALNFDIVDIAVEPEHQGKGLGRIIMEHIMAFLNKEAPKGAYICLMADVPELYEKFGFKLTRPHSEGMYITK